ncbi:hypothetical protein J3459_016272 [Metarhizium acridum]|nr:hypothetical protein J3459_016272 [Metarhizium acridum]
MSGRQLIPKSSFPPLQQIEKPEGNQVHKRQGVTLACDRCRKRKAKCDGGRPSCRACLIASAECKYTTRGSSLAQRHVGLQESYNELRQAVEAICAVSERDAADIVRHVRRAQGLDNIIPSLCSHPSVEQYRLLSPEQQRDWMKDPDSPGPVPSEQLANRAENVYLLPISQWTTVSQDDTWLSHLLRLFWTWDTTLTRLIHRDLLGDMISTRRDNNGKADSQFVAQFCSELLINSILAYSSSCFTFMSNYKPVQGHDFAEESYRLLETQPLNNCIALLQAVAVLSVYEYTFGDPQKGTSLFFETLLDLRSTLLPVDQSIAPDDSGMKQKTQDALSFISSGFYCIDVKLSLIASPCLPSRWTSQVLPNDGHGPSPNMQRHADTLWVPYPVSVNSRISYSTEALTAEYELVRLTTECLEVTELNGQALMPNHLDSATIYDRLVHWKDFNARRFYGSSSIIPSWVAILVHQTTRAIYSLALPEF